MTGQDNIASQDKADQPTLGPVSPPPRNHPPVVVLIRPIDGRTFQTGASVKLTAVAVDLDGRIESVEFLANEKPIGGVIVSAEVDPGPHLGNPIRHLLGPHVFDLTWEPVAQGRFSLTAVARDDQGAIRTSRAIQIRVVEPEPPPVVNLTATDPDAAEPTAAGILPPIGRGDPIPGPGRGRLDFLDTGSFLIVRTGDSHRPLLVEFQVSGRARPGRDFEPIGNQVLIPAGQSAATIVIKPLDDALAEVAEDVTLRLLPGRCGGRRRNGVRCYKLGQQTVARVTIKDNDQEVNQPPRVKIISPREGQTFAGSASIPIQVQAVDPDGWVGQIAFFAGGKLLNEQAITFLRAPDPGQTQTFAWDWETPPPGRHEIVAVATDDRGDKAKSLPVTVTVGTPIIQRTVVWVEALRPETSEPDPKIRVAPAVFRVHRDGNIDIDLDVMFQLQGSATNGKDYRRLPNTIRIPRGEISSDLSIEPLDDTLAEGTETVVLQLVTPVCILIFPPPPECYLLGKQPRAEVKIFDNQDAAHRPPRIAIVSPRPKETFLSRGTILLRAEALDPDGWIPQVDFWADGAFLGNQRITFIRKPDPGQKQSFFLEWKDPPAGKHQLSAIATDDTGAGSLSRPVTITVIGEGDPPVITLFAHDGAGSERTARADGGPNSAAFRVHRTGRPDRELTVLYAIAGTAENGVDYQALDGRIVIPPRKRWGEIKIIPISDDATERPETVVLELSDTRPGVASDYVLGQPARAAAVITDRPPPDMGLGRLDDGLVHVCIPATDGESFRLEVSNNLGEWDVLYHDTVVDGAVQIVDTEAASGAARFFRVIPDIDPEAEE